MKRKERIAGIRNIILLLPPTNFTYGNQPKGSASTFKRKSPYKTNDAVPAAVLSLSAQTLFFFYGLTIRGGTSAVILCHKAGRGTLH